jgi:hypothetical protein
MIFEKVAKRFWRQREKAGGTWNGSNDIQTDEPDFGLHTIVPRDRELVNFVDIVAIHGLNGHYLKTWTDEKTGVNWLSDLIPRIIKNARVMSFWYNSKVQFSKSKSGILEFADQLLGSLIASREGYVEEQRPIIFLCHSLGGLVFKQVRCSRKHMFCGLRNVR